MRTNISFNKCLSSNLLLQTQILINKKRLPDCFADFVVLLALLPKNATFSYEELKAIAKQRFKRLFNNTTFKGQIIKPFEKFFTLLKGNFYHNKGIIQKVSYNLYKVANLQSTLEEFTPHLSLFNVMINESDILMYDSNMSELIKDCIFECIRNLSILSPNTEYTHRLIKKIFGLSKADFKKRVKKSSTKIKYVYRTIGHKESYDLELNQNLFKGKHKCISSFKLVVPTTSKDFFLDMKINHKSLFTIKERLQLQKFSFSAKDFFFHYNASVPNTKNDLWVFRKQYERLGYRLYESNHKLYRLKEYIEAVNLGVFKQCKNIYSYLCKNFDENYQFKKRNFKESLAGLKVTHVFQLPTSSIA